MLRFWKNITLESAACFLLASCSARPMQEGQFACASAPDCPPGWVCRTDGYCYSDGDTGIVTATSLATDGDTDTGSTDELLNGMAVTRFVLINSESDLDIGELENHATLRLGETGDRLNVRADTIGAVDKVAFWSNGSLSREEKDAPFALAGNGIGEAVDSDYEDWTPTVGPYTLKAIPYDREGLIGSALTIEFTVGP